MKSRLELSEILNTLADHVYFQPTTGTRIQYPCIIYERASGLDIPADNRSYLFTQSYTVTVIDKNPDSEIPEKVRQTFAPMCTTERHFVNDGLNHDVYLIYF